MIVRDVMTQFARTVDSSELVADAAEHMRDHDVGLLPVMESGRLTGMITDRDLVLRAVAEGKDPALTTVREIMSPRVVTVFVDQPLDDAVAILHSNNVRRAAVIDHSRRLVGILSEHDLQEGTPSSQRESRPANGSDGVRGWAVGFGLLSVGFAGAMLAAPRRFAKLFEMPDSADLIRALAARDLLIGGALLVPATRRAGFALRAAADTCDAVVIGEHTLTTNRRKMGGVLLALSALATAAWSLRCHARLGGE